ncbi:hypothetical protein [Chenggangzhangella methanolivorans]|uniref:Uncharacterized protein n=1 Tax=Chenggangzhangella methanolivorans TaxID=1437009 RepID=A0A9E6RCX5_9HYPH|nr:hypothetical protein [Chenggangzhangella methanolivorans]QZN98730.1 hypothetical protein K6K41_17275 [Chenggangzhangella methanolivorans]
MTLNYAAGALAFALLASPTLADTPPLGAPSEPTVWGHRVHAPEPAQEIEAVGLKRSTAPEARPGFVPSEPTIWGHRPEGGR